MPHVVMITEGTYPYFGGGVSRWCEVLLSRLMEYQFTIIAIVPQQKVSEKYVLPKNITEVILVRIGYLSQYAALEDVNINNSDLEMLVNQTRNLHNHFSNNDIASAVKTTKELIPMLQNNPIAFWRHNKALKYLEERYKALEPELPFYKWLIYWKNTHALHLSLMAQKIPEADLFHATNSGWAGLIGMIGAQRYNKPLLLTEHGIALRERGIAIEKWEEAPTYERLSLAQISMRLSQLIYESSDLITSVCKANKNWLVNNLGIPEQKIKVTYNGVDIDTFKPKQIPKQLNNIVATIARIFPLKDIKNLIKSANIVSKKRNDITFVVVGGAADQEYYQECVNLVKDLNLKNFEFVGSSSSVIAWYNRMGVFCLSSMSEGFPLTTIEAMACGTPAIVTNVGGAGEPIRVGKRSCGIVVPPNNPKKLAEAILFIFENPNHYKILSRNARFLAETYFSESKFVKEYENIYDQLITYRIDRYEGISN